MRHDWTIGQWRYLTTLLETDRTRMREAGEHTLADVAAACLDKIRNCEDAGAPRDLVPRAHLPVQKQVRK